jgi:exonuclease VII small subunit
MSSCQKVTAKVMPNKISVDELNQFVKTLRQRTLTLTTSLKKFGAENRRIRWLRKKLQKRKLLKRKLLRKKLLRRNSFSS